MKRFDNRWMGNVVGRVWLLFCLCVSASLAQAQVTIESVTGSLQSGVEVVKIDLSQALTALPAGFSIQSPARIALDFPNVVSAMGRSTVDVNQGNLKSVSVVQAGSRTRVVLNLKQYVTYKTQLQGKSLLVVLDAVAGVAPAAASVVFAPPESRDTQPLKDLDFRRGDEGSGRVVVTLPNNQVGVDIRQQGQTLVVEFMKTTLPEGLRRRLDVADFGTPIKMVTASQAGDRVRMVIEPQGLWTHSAYQSDEQFVVEVKAVKVDPNKLTQGPGYSGEKLSLNFQNIEVRSLLQVIADFTSFNIITSDSVNGAVTLRLQDVPWDQALDIILQAKGLGMRKTGTVIWIAPKDEILAKEKLELESKAAVLSLEPVRTQSFQLNYAKAVDVAAYLAATAAGGATGANANTSRVLSSRGSAVAEPRTNQLFVTDVPSKLEEVQQMIKQLDIPVRQVLIEARIVEASDTFGRTLGVKLGATDLRAKKGGDGGYSVGNGNRVAVGTSYGNVVGSTGAGENVNVNEQFVNLPSPLLLNNTSAPATFAVSLFSAAANRFLNLELSALEQDNKGRIISSPRVVTADQQEAKITQGKNITFITVSDEGKPGKETVTANLSLTVTPRITPDGDVILKVNIEKNSLDSITANSAIVNNKTINTEILVESGGTIVIGGIYEMLETNNETKVPLFGDIPVFGNLFKNKARNTDKQEMLIFITPKIVSNKSLR